jgi:hypothetical protein
VQRATNIHDFQTVHAQTSVSAKAGGGVGDGVEVVVRVATEISSGVSAGMGLLGV